MSHKPTITLMQHQRRAAEICAREPRFGFWLACGVGKTITMLAALDASKAAREAKAAAGALGFPEAEPEHVDGLPPMPYYKTVVVCPKAIILNAWCRDAEHFPGLRVVPCWASTPAKRAGLIATPGADVLVLNFELFKKHRKDLWLAGVRRLIVDESSKIKNHDSQITKMLIEFADHMESVYLLSGTPAPNDATEYWPQMRAIDKRVFGESFYRFASQYFAPQKRTINGRQVVTGYRALPQKNVEFMKRLQARSWSLRKEDALDLPEQLDIIREVELAPEERRAYSEVEASLRVELAGGTVNVRAEALMTKLRQLCGGWMYDGDQGAVKTGQSKLDALADILDEIGNEQIVVWADFREDLARIAALLEARGVRHERLDGGFRGDSSDVVRRFQSGEIRALVCHPASVGHGVTLTAASYAVFYTLPWSYELYQQARDRIHRKGQRSACTYFHLLAAETLDRGVLWAVKNKGKKLDAVMKALSGEGRAAA